jgi:hypothetical protein
MLDSSSFTGDAVFAFDRQLLLVELIGELDWTYDLQLGLLCFGDRFQWQAEVLGTESDGTATWLWAWANEASSIPAEQQAASLKLRALGAERGIVALTAPAVTLEPEIGRVFASIAVGEGLGKAHFRGPYEGGAVLLLITDQRLQFDVEEPLRRVLTVFPQAIAALVMADHREALRGYLQHYDLQAEENGNVLLLRQHGQVVLQAEFDEHRRLRQLKGTLAERERSRVP